MIIIDTKVLIKEKPDFFDNEKKNLKKYQKFL